MGHAPQRRGLRILIGFAGLLLIFAAAWFWQERYLADSRRAFGNAPTLLSSGVEAEPELDQEEPGWGRIVLGRPSNAAPTPRPEPIEPPAELPPGPSPSEVPGETGPTIVPDPDPVPAPPAWPTDQELKVRPGQSLSKIIAQAYGRSTLDLVARLAAYNGMTDANKLIVGQVLYIPVQEKLDAVQP